MNASRLSSILLVVAALGLGGCGAPASTDPDGASQLANAGVCVAGTLECECDGLGVCGDGLTCDVWDRCVPLGTDTGFAGDGFNDGGSCDAVELACSERASCVIIEGAPTCVCDDGWEGSGEFCLEAQAI